MAKEKQHLRMDDVGPRLDSIIRQMRAEHEQWGRLIEKMRAIHERQERLIEELATIATAAQGWRVLAEANGVKLDKDG